MRLRSVNFRNNERLPDEFTSLSDSPISPNLYWTDFPDNTKSFVLVMRKGPILHWFLIDIPRDINYIGPNEIAGNEIIPYEAPHREDRPNVYQFEVYALDRMLYTTELTDLEPEYIYSYIRRYTLDYASIQAIL
jgi:phosphatidylethanolamine-binding protein (PEBP) family uncharacterized protein